MSIQTTKGKLFTAEEMLIAEGKDPEDLKLTTGEKRIAKKMGVKFEQARQAKLGKGIDQHRIPRAEMEALKAKGQLESKHEKPKKKVIVTMPEAVQASKMHLDPEDLRWSKRMRGNVEQSFRTKAERTAQEAKKSDSLVWDNRLSKYISKKEFDKREARRKNTARIW